MADKQMVTWPKNMERSAGLVEKTEVEDPAKIGEPENAGATEPAKIDENDKGNSRHQKKQGDSVEYKVHDFIAYKICMDFGYDLPPTLKGIMQQPPTQAVKEQLHDVFELEVIRNDEAEKGLEDKYVLKSMDGNDNKLYDFKPLFTRFKKPPTNGC